jgi:hypothetical protein
MEGGGGKSVSKVDGDSKEENSYRLLSQLRPRIRPLDCIVERTHIQEIMVL